MGINANTLLRKFGDKVRDERLRAGLSQEELGFKAELDRTYISGIERGERNPSVKSVAKIANSLGVSIKKLFDF